MYRLIVGVTVLALGAGLAGADEPSAKGEKVGHEMYGPYFEKTTSGLKGDASHLAITDQAAFDKTFGSGFTMGARPRLIPKDTFDKHIVVAVIKRGSSIHTYKVEGVTADGGTLTVKYKAEAGPASATARFSSPLILTVEKGKLEKVVFIENGKEAGTAVIK